MAGLPGLPPPGFSNTTAEEVLAPKPGLPGLPPPGFSSYEEPSWNIWDSAKNYASGAVENIGGMIGLAADLNPFDMDRFKLNEETGKIERAWPWDFQRSKQIQQALEPYLAEKDEDYRYARTLGQFTGPGGLFGAAGKVLKGAPAAASKLLAMLAGGFGPSTVAAGLGAQAAEDLTGDQYIAPLIGAVGAGSVTSLLDDSIRGVGRIAKGATPDRIKATAATALKEYTDLSDEAIRAAIEARPADDLARYMTTAELTDNAGLAQLELDLSKAGPNAVEYSRRANLRERIRNDVLDRMSQSKAVNREGLGSALQAKAVDTLERLDLEGKNLWSAFPRYEAINVQPLQMELDKMLKSRQGGFQPGSKSRELIGQILGETEDDIIRTSGALQDIRSDALKLLRDGNLDAIEERALGAISAGIDDAMSKGLKGKAYNLWETAREHTANTQKLFQRTSAGGSMVSDAARPANILANAFKGDSKSAIEIKKALSGDPALLEQVKRGVLDMVPRDSQNQLTAAGVKKFLDANENGLKTLLGDDHYKNFTRVLDDLQSEAKVSRIANRASKGQSQTAQKLAVAGSVRNIILGNVAPGSRAIASLVDEIQAVAGTRVAERVDELLFQAALEPDFALDLLKTPTNNRIQGTLERLKQFATNAAGAGKTAALLEVSRPQFNIADAEGGKPEPRSLELQTKTPTTTAGTTPPKQQEKQSQELNLASYLNSTTKNASANPIDQALNKAEMKIKGEKAAPLIIDPKTSEEDLKPVIERMVKTESAGNAKAVSPKGAQGLMQLMPATGREMAKKMGVTYRPYDAKQNRMLGTAYFKQLLEQFDGNLVYAVAAYNVGPAGLRLVLKGKKKLPAETRDYVRKVLGTEFKVYA